MWGCRGLRAGSRRTDEEASHRVPALGVFSRSTDEHARVTEGEAGRVRQQSGLTAATMRRDVYPPTGEPERTDKAGVSPGSGSLRSACSCWPWPPAACRTGSPSWWPSRPRPSSPATCASAVLRSPNRRRPPHLHRRRGMSARSGIRLNGDVYAVRDSAGNAVVQPREARTGSPDVSAARATTKSGEGPRRPPQALAPLPTASPVYPDDRCPCGGTPWLWRAPRFIAVPARQRWTRPGEGPMS
ncbi:hypothetical protein J2X68_005185 [Streptomyces sp. 3330]|nr:hypothetical protein [Streptomyces sp. 3330]